MEREITFKVPFLKGKQRPRYVKKGAYVTAYTPKDTRLAERAIADAYQLASLEAYGKVIKATKGEPVHLHIHTQAFMPKSSKATIEHNTYKPDIDNTIKLVMDGLNGVAYEDDTQVTHVTGTKLPRRKQISTTCPYTQATVYLFTQE